MSKENTFGLLGYLGMKVFISWSKEPSKSVAAALTTWLKDVIQSLDPWMSDQNIQSGQRWSATIGEELQNNNFGIIVLTTDNQMEPWINFEAGALSKVIGVGRVVPYVYGSTFVNISSPPLTQFQGVEANKSGTFRLVSDINALIQNPLSEAQLTKAFDKHWPDLETEYGRIDSHVVVARSTKDTVKQNRSDEDKIDELLSLMRGLSLSRSDRSLSNLKNITNRIKVNEDMLGYLTKKINEISKRYEFVKSITHSESGQEVDVIVSESSIEQIDKVTSDVAKVMNLLGLDWSIKITHLKPRSNPRTP